MFRRSFLRSVTAFALLSLVLGCTAEVATTGPAETPNPAAQAPHAATPTSTQPGVRKNGFFVAALREPIQLTPDQRRTIEGLLANLPESPSLASALAATFRCEETEPDRIAAVYSEALRKVVTPAAAPLNALHATLKPEQRAALVAAMSSPSSPDFQLATAIKTVKRAKVPGGEQTATEDGAPSAADIATIAAVRERITNEYKARLQRFAADDFDGVAFVMSKVMPDKLRPAEFGGKVAAMSRAQREEAAARFDASR